MELFNPNLVESVSMYDSLIRTLEENPTLVGEDENVKKRILKELLINKDLKFFKSKEEGKRYVNCSNINMNSNSEKLMLQYIIYPTLAKYLDNIVKSVSEILVKEKLIKSAEELRISSQDVYEAYVKDFIIKNVDKYYDMRIKIYTADVMSDNSFKINTSHAVITLKQIFEIFYFKYKMDDYVIYESPDNAMLDKKISKETYEKKNLDVIKMFTTLKLNNSSFSTQDDSTKNSYYPRIVCFDFFNTSKVIQKIDSDVFLHELYIIGLDDPKVELTRTLRKFCD